MVNSEKIEPTTPLTTMVSEGAAGADINNFGQFGVSFSVHDGNMVSRLDHLCSDQLFFACNLHGHHVVICQGDLMTAACRQCEHLAGGTRVEIDSDSFREVES